MDLTADTERLRSDGAGLQATASPSGSVPHCQPAAADPISGSVAHTFSYWSHVLWALMEHAGQQREQGGLSFTGVAHHLDSVDTAHAGAILGVLGGASTGSLPDSAPAPMNLSPIAPPTLPPLPAMPAPAPMTGEQVAALVHSQPSPDHLRTFADRWRTQVGPHILAAADDTRSHGNRVANDWDDGDPAAVRNVHKHADWLESDLHGGVKSLAASADEAASHADDLIQNTPRPEEFRDLHKRLNTAMAHYRASGGMNGAEVLALNSELGQKNEAALTAYSTYSAAAPTTTTGAGQPPPPSPAIVGNLDAMTKGSNELIHPKTGGSKGKSGDGSDNDGAGGTTLDPGQADSGPVGPSGTIPAAPAPPLGANGASPAAGIAGQLLGAGMGAFGQLGNSFKGLSGGSPMSALSSLSSLGTMPQSGSPQLPSDGGGDQGGDSKPDLGADPDFGSGGTTPAGGGDGGGAPMSSASPAVSASPSSALGPTVGTTAMASPSPGPGGMGGSGMFAPPMMGGMGRGNAEERTSQERRRVVMRSVDNSEPVFGEMERRRSARRQSQSARKDDDVKESQ